jgi:hypothetical protein
MSDNNQTAEEKKNAPQITAGIAASLKPQMPESIRVALSVKQNFALAAEEIFVHALSRTVWNYRDKYMAVEIIMAEIRNTAMESVATEAGVARISDLVFRNEVMREFLFTLQVQFFSQFGEFHQNWVEMINYIATALTNGVIGHEVDPKLNLVPEDIRMRTYDAKHMSNLLLANTWLIMFLLIALWGRTHTYEELRALRRTAVAG